MASLGLREANENTGKVTPIIPCRPTEAAMAMVVGWRTKLRTELRMGTVLVIISVWVFFW